MEVEAECGGLQCGGDFLQIASCNSQPCPVDCKWGEWSDWEECSRDCGGGSQQRRRKVEVEAKFGGAACSGVLTEDR